MKKLLFAALLFAGFAQAQTVAPNYGYPNGGTIGSTVILCPGTASPPLVAQATPCVFGNGGGAQTVTQGSAGTIGQSWYVENTDGTNVIGTSAKPFYSLISGSLPAGSNALGSITNTSFGISGTLPAFATTPTFIIGAGSAAIGSVSVSNFPATQPVSGTVTANVQGGNTTAVKVDGSAVTQPVSGTVTVTPSGTQNVSGTVTTTPSGTQNVNESQINGVAIPTGIGTSAGAQRVVIGNDSVVTTNAAQGSTLTTGQQTVTTTAVQVFAAGTGLVSKQLINESTNVTLRVGGAGVTATTGFAVPPGYAYDFSQGSGALFAVTASGSAPVSTITY